MVHERLSEASSSAALERARTHMLAGRLSEAADAARCGLAQDPHDLSLRVLLIEALLRRERLAEAETEIKALERATHEALLPLKSCAAELCAGRCLEAAGLALKACLGLCPQDAEALALRSRLTYEQKGRSAPKVLRAAPPALADAEFAADLATATLAEIYYAQGQLAEAVAVYTAVTQRRPADAHARRRLAELRRLADQNTSGRKAAPPVVLPGVHHLLPVLEQWQQRLRERLRSPHRPPPRGARS